MGPLSLLGQILMIECNEFRRIHSAHLLLLHSVHK